MQSVPGRAYHLLRNNNKHHFHYRLPVGKVSHARTALSRNEAADIASAGDKRPRAPAKLARRSCVVQLSIRRIDITTLIR